MQGSQQCFLIKEGQGICLNCDCQSRVLTDCAKCRGSIVVADSNQREVDSIELGSKF